jgi:hypothetical protein
MRTFLDAFTTGLGRAGRAWRVVLLLWAVNLAVALPFAAAVAHELRGSLDRSRVHRDLLAGFDADWHGEFQAHAGPLAKTFGPELIGAGAFFENLERWWSGGLLALPPALVAAGILHAVLWAFLLGGVLERLREPGAVAAAGAAGFFAACGRHAFRFLRLALLSGVLYYLVYRLARAGFGALEDAARDVTSERSVLFWVIAGAALTVFLLAVVRVVFDYAKIAVVAHGRRSALGAAWAGARFVASRPFATLGLWAGFALLGAALLALYSLLPAFTGVATWASVVLVLLVGQLALAVKLALRLALLGAETRLFSGR